MITRRIINWKNTQHGQYSCSTSTQISLAPAFLIACLVATSGFAVASNAGHQSQANASAPQVEPKVDSHEPTGAISPEGAGLEFFFGMVTGDPDRIKNVCLTTGVVWQVTKVSAEFAPVAAQFRRRFIQAYGRAAWDTFNNPDHEPPSVNGAAANGSLTILEVAEFARVWRELRDNQSEGRSRCRYPGNGDLEMVVVQKEGRWFVDNEKSMPIEGEAEAKNITKLFTELSSVVHQGSAAIGLKDVTPDQIDFELGRLTMKILKNMDIAPLKELEFEKLPAPNQGPTERGLATAEMSKTMLQTLLAGGNDDGYEQLHPVIQKITDPNVFENQIENLRAALQGVQASDVKIELVEPATNKDSWQVIAQFEHQGHTGLMDLFLFENKLVGVQVLFDRFAMDSRFATQNTKPISDVAESLFTAVFNHDFETFKKHFGNNREGFESGFADILSKDFKNVRALEPTLNIQWPPSETGLMLNCWRMIEYELEGHLTRIPGQTVSKLSSDGPPEIDDLNLSRTSDSFYCNRLEAMEATLKTLASGDVDMVMNSMAPSVASEFEKPVFKAYLKSISGTLGEFKSIDVTTSSTRTMFEKYDKTAVWRGKVSFAQQEVSTKLTYEDDWLVGFMFYDSNNNDGWQANIDDLEPFVTRGKLLCEEYFDGDVKKMAEMCCASMRNSLLKDLETWQKRVLTLHEDFGQTKSVVAGKTEYVPDEFVWRCHYQINFEAGHFKTYVDFYPTAARSEIVNFNYKWFENETKPATESEPAGE